MHECNFFSIALLCNDVVLVQISQNNQVKNQAILLGSHSENRGRCILWFVLWSCPEFDNKIRSQKEENYKCKARYTLIISTVSGLIQVDPKFQVSRGNTVTHWLKINEARKMPPQLKTFFCTNLMTWVWSWGFIVERENLKLDLSLLPMHRGTRLPIHYTHHHHYHHHQ